MSKKIKVLSGDRYGKLLILSEVKNSKGRRMFKCKCDCGNIRYIMLSHLRNGHTTSCGCNHHRLGNVKHGMYYTKEYGSWKSLKSRCFNINDQAYQYYGGRGITVCDRWMNSFENFYKDMGPAPSGEHSIDRIDNDGDYEPNNCRWVTYKEQNRNTRGNRMVKIGDVFKSLAEWAEDVGGNYHAIRMRLIRGWPPEKAIYGKLRKWNRQK